MPAPPPKPRDIILEKWLPTKESSSTQRPIYYQKAYKTMTQSQLFTNSQQQKQIYEIVDNQSNHHYHQQQQRSNRDHTPNYEYVNSDSSSKKFYKQIISNNNYNSNKKQQHQQPSSEQSEIYAPPNTQIYASPSHQTLQQVFVPPEVYYTPSSNRKSKVAGYRIIRQIIPGPNSTPADIEKALARSQRISTVYANQKKNYSPSFDLNNSVQYPIYSDQQQQQQQQQTYDYYYSSPKNSASNTYVSSGNLHPIYGQHPVVYTNSSNINKQDVYRSSSIDNF